MGSFVDPIYAGAGGVLAIARVGGSGTVVLTARSPIFDTMLSSAALAIIFFSVLDLVAGVGLWLATPWGGFCGSSSPARRFLSRPTCRDFSPAVTGLSELI